MCLNGERQRGEILFCLFTAKPLLTQLYTNDCVCGTLWIRQVLTGKHLPGALLKGLYLFYLVQLFFRLC